MILRSARAARGRRVSHSWCMCVVVMAMVGWMGAGMELVFGKHAGCRKHVERCQSTFRVRGDKLMIPDHTTIQVRSSGYG